MIPSITQPNSPDWRKRLAPTRLLLLGTLLLSASLLQAQVAAWDFGGLAGGPNDYGPSPFAPGTADANVTVGGLTRGSGVTQSGTGAANGWGGTGFDGPTSLNAAITANNFATFTVVANTGYALSLSDISAYNIRRSSSGPTTGQWQYSIDNGGFVNIGAAITWGANTAASGNAQAAIDLSGISELQDIPAGAVVTFRVVSWSATSSSGSWYLNDPEDDAAADFTLNGSVFACTNPPVPAGPITAIGCESIDLNIDGNPTLGSGTYTAHLWTDLGTGTATGVSLSNETTQVVTLNAASSGTVNLRYKVTDNNGCTGTKDVAVTINAAPSGALSATENSGVASNDNQICAGASITFTATSGFNNYAFSINGSLQQSGMSNTFTTTAINDGDDVEVLATDNAGCEAVIGALNITVHALPVPMISAQTNVSCNGLSDGSVTISGGTEYSLDGGPFQASGTFSGLAAGAYTVTVKNANNCTQTQVVNITQPAVLNVSITGSTNVSCFNGANGTATALATGGTSPYNYDWPGSPTNDGFANVSGLTAGTYTVTVTDINLCQATTSVEISQPTQVLATISAQGNVSCFGGTNGTATVSASGGTPGYTYDWEGSPTGDGGVSISNLAAGTYTVTVSDLNSCTTTTAAVITQPSQVLATISAQGNVSCFGGTNGTATVSASGGTPGYTYDWEGSPTGDGTTMISGLAAGTYTVTVTDLNSCSTTTAAVITQPAVLAATISSSQNVSCNGGANGTATVTPTGGTMPYSYDWSGTPTGEGTPSVSGLAAGTYSVTITDANLCQTSTSVTISEPTALTAAITAQTNVTCNSGNNGAATVTANGGTIPYSYDWHASPNGDGTPSITDLIAVTFTVTVTDGLGCQTTAAAVITQPDPMSATVITQTNVSCNGGSDGAVSINVTGGTSPYSYNWDGTPMGDGSPSISMLAAGAYFVTVLDVNNCPLLYSVVITQPAVLSATISGFTNVSCFGGTNGTANLNISGGTMPYTIDWEGNPTGDGTTAISMLAAGTYTVTVTDAKLCVSTTSVIITEPAVLSASISTQMNVSCNGGTNGTASVLVSGGTMSYSYDWTGNTSGDGTPSVSNLAAGTYTVTVTDANTCMTSTSVTITEPAVLVLTATPVQPCTGFLGSVNLSAVGGTMPYVFSGDPVSNLAAGTYNYTVTDNNGCQDTESATITPFALPTVDPITGINYTYIGSTTQLSNATLGGVWSSASTGVATVDGAGLVAGVSTGTSVISYTVTDMNGCVNASTTTVYVSVPILDIGLFDYQNPMPAGNKLKVKYRPVIDIPNVVNNYTDGQFTIRCLTSLGVTFNIPPASNPFGYQQIGGPITNGLYSYYRFSFVLNAPKTITGSAGQEYDLVLLEYACKDNATFEIINDAFAASINGDYYQELTINSVAGDQANIIYAPIATSASLPTITATAMPTTLCVGASLDLNSSTNDGVGPFSYAWSGPDAYSSSVADPGAFTVSAFSAGTYTVVVTDAVNGCTASDDVLVNVPVPAVSATGGTFNRTQPVVISATAPTAVTYAWEGPNGYSGSGNPAAPAPPSNDPAYSGTYTVTVTDANSCTNTATATVVIYPAALYVNDNALSGDSYTTAVGNDNNPGTPALPLRTIQKAVDVALAGDEIYVDAGTYEENANISKSVKLNGPNATVSPNTGSRIAEAVIVPPASSTTTNLVTVTASNVEINGFTIDGDNTALPASGQGLSGSTDAPRGVFLSTDGADGLKVQRNIIRNFIFAGVRIQQNSNWFPTNAAATFSSFHLVDDNLIKDIGDNAGSGQGVDLRNSAYCAVSNNVIDNALTGILIGPFRITHDGGTTYQNITGNTIRARRYGIWFNLYRAEPYTVTSNTIEAVADAASPEWFGVFMANVAVPQNFFNQVRLPLAGTPVKWSYSNNTIDGANMHPSTIGYGYWLWSVDNNRDGNGITGTDHYGTISGGSVSNVNTGIYMSNAVNPYPSFGTGTTGAHAAVSNVSFSLKPGGVGIYMKDDAAWSSGSISPLVAKRNVMLTTGAGLSFSGGAKGIVLDFPDPSTAGFTAYDAFTGASINTLSFSAQTGNYVEMLKYNRNLDATGTVFGGINGATATVPQLYTIENKILHDIDDAALGYVSVKANTASVTQASFSTPATTTPSIQRAINALGSAGAVNIEGGATVYTGGGDASSKDIAFHPGSSPGCVSINGNLTLNSGDVLNMELNSATPCTGYDQFTVSGTVTLGGASLNLTLGYVPSNGDVITLIDGTSAVIGQFAQGATITVGGYVFAINYAGGDGFDVVLTSCGTGSVHNTSYLPNRHYCKIQDAINDALSGHTIEVDAGTYNENLTINGKSGLILKGPNAGLNNANGTRVAEANIVAVANAPVVTVESNVTAYTLDGFRIVGADYTEANNGRLVWAKGQNTVSNVVNNVLELTSNATDTKRYIWLGGSGSVSSGSLFISGNISHNLFKAFGTGSGFNGITTQQWSQNFNIHANKFEGMTGQRNILVWHPTPTVVISNNELNRTDNGGDLISIQGAAPTVTAGGVVIQNNLFNSPGKGVLIGSGVNFPTTITENHFGNVGGLALEIQSGSGTVVTANCNWWGTANANAIPTEIMFSTPASVNFTPWLLGAGDGAGMGFQPTASCTGTSVVITAATPTSSTFCASNGSIAVDFTGGIAPYTIAWDGTASGGPVAATSIYTINTLAAGTSGITVTDFNGSTATASVNLSNLPVRNNSGPSYYATIQAAINAATAGDVLEVCEGTYTEAININKALTINGPNVGISGTGARVAEAVLLNSTIDINNAGNTTIDGFHIKRTDGAGGPTNQLELDGGGTNTVQNCIFERLGGNTGQEIRAMVTTTGGGPKVIANNKITGDASGGLFSGHKSWARGIYVDAGAFTVNISGNTFENCRTAMNVDDYNNNLSIAGNTFNNNGTQLSLGGATLPSGSFVMGANNFINNAASTMVNLSNVAESFRLDMTSSSLNGTAFSALSNALLFEVESRMAHKEVSASKRGKVIYKTNNQYVNNFTTPGTKIDKIQNSIKYADAGDIINLEDGTYNEKLVVDKSNLTLQGVTNDKTLYLIDGTGLGVTSGIYLDNGVTNITVKDLTVQKFTGLSGNTHAGIYANAGNNNLTLTNVALLDNPNASGFYANGPINNVSVTNSMVANNGSGARGIVLWNGLKTNIAITGNMVTNNSCCGIELQDGDASAVNVSNNTIDIGGGDNAIGLVGLNLSTGANVINNNIITGGGRFGIEIKNPSGGVTVSGNSVTLTTQNSDVRDRAGIAVFRRGVLGGNIDVPNGVSVTGNTVAGYQQSSSSEGFGIVIEGTNHVVTGNTVNNCEVGILQQQNPSNYPGDADQSNVADQFFGRGNAPWTCGNTISGNTFSGNGTDTRNIGVGFGLVSNVSSGEYFCSIQKANNDAQTQDGHILTVAAGTYAESISLTKGLTLRGPNHALIPCVDTRVTEAIITGGLNIDNGTTKTVVVEGFHFQGVTSPFNYNGNVGTAALTATFRRNLVNASSGQLAAFTGNATNTLDITITENCFQNMSGNAMQVGGSADGVTNAQITKNTINGTVTAGINTDALTNSTIDGNTISNTTQQGIQVAGTSGNVTVSNNVITNANTGLSADRGGIRIRGANLTGPLNVTNNIISGSLNGIAIANGENISGKTILVNDNSLSGNTASVYHGGTGTLNAECNWHGSVIYNTILAQIGGVGAANVDFVSYLTNGTDNDGGAIGFQPVPGNCLGTPVVITAATPQNYLCGETSGSINVVFSGGTAPYNIAWTGGGSATGVSSPYTITNLVAGAYTITVTDALSSTATFLATVQYLPVTNTTDGLYFASIQQAIDAATTDNGEVLVVCAGTFTENITVNKSLDIRGANYGLAGCNGRGTESTVNAATGTGFTITADNVSIDGFEIIGYAGIAANASEGTALRNNKITTELAGIQANNIVTTASLGFVIEDNCISQTTRVVGGTQATTGIYLNGLSGAQAVVVDDNTVSGGYYGYVLYGVNTTPPTSVSGGTISGAMQGVAVVNTVGGPLAPTNALVEDISMSGFATASPVLPASHFNAGVYTFTASPSTPANGITLTVSNVTVDGTQAINAPSGAVYVADFSTGGPTVQNITVQACNFLNNANRGVDAGGYVEVTVNQSTLTNNGNAAWGIGGNDGFAFIAQRGATLNVSNCFINHPATSTTPVTAFLVGNAPASTINASNNSILTNGNAQAFGTGTSNGFINATCNWWGTANIDVFELLLNGAVFFTPYLNSGTDNEIATPGFQPAPGTCVTPTDFYVNDNSQVGDLLTTAVGSDVLPGTRGTKNRPFLTIAAAINAAVNGDDVFVDIGNYYAQTIVNKDVTIQGAGTSTYPVIDFAGTVSGKPTLFDITADGVTIDHLQFQVDLSKLNSAIIASAVNLDNIAVQNNVINPYKSVLNTYFGSYGNRNAISINYGGPTNYRVAAGGVNNILVNNNRVTATVIGTFLGDGNDDTGFRSAVSVDEGAGTFTNNTFQTINHDVLVRFNSNGPIQISDNTFNGGGVTVAEHNAGGGAVMIEDNTFDGSVTASVLRLQNNQQGKLTTVQNNIFNNLRWGISLENYPAATISGNTFNPIAGSTDFRHVTVNTKSLSSNSATIVQVPIDAVITGNTFNSGTGTGGTALAFYNHDSDNAVLSANFTVGTAGSPNAFGPNFTHAVYFGDQTGPTFPAPLAFPEYNLGAGSNTTMACWTRDIDIRNNTFDVGAGQQLPPAMNSVQRAALEAKLYHQPDNNCLGELIFFLPVEVVAKVFLQGPYNPATNTMADNLRQITTPPLFPVSEPYSQYNTVEYNFAFVPVNNTATEVTTPLVLSNNDVNNAIVDWIWLELRDKNDHTIVRATRAALLQRDGDIVDVDGVSNVVFPDAYIDQYYLMIKHRNHLGAMTADPINYTGGPVSTDFTLASFNTFGTTATSARKELEPGVWGLLAGNTNLKANGTSFQVRYNGSNNDRVPILNIVGATTPLNVVNGYLIEDVNLNGQVKYSGSNNDRIIILNNINPSTPLNTITQQPQE